MFSSILVGICDREQSAAVTRQAIWLAQLERARLIGLHVVDEQELVVPPGTEGVTSEDWRSEVEPELRAMGQSLLDQFAMESSEAGVSAEVRLLVGPVAKTICREARAADLVVMGRGGEYARRSALLGCHVLEGVVRHSARPVLVAATVPRRIDRILVAYDGSPRAGQALALAAQLRRDWSVPLLVVTVVERNVGMPALARARSCLEPYAPPEKMLLREGTPAVEILRACEEEGADLVVMGAYCHGPVQEALIGGTVGQVVKRGDRPVLIGS